MTTATVEEKFDIQKLTPPDTSNLPKIDFPGMLLLRVVDEDSLQTARANAVAARQYIADVGLIFDEPTSLAHRLHKWFTGMRSKLVEPAEKVDAYSKSEIGRYLQEQERKRVELEQKLQREAEEAARIAAKQQQEELDVFALLEKVDAPPPPPPAVPSVRVAQQSHAGVGTANLPWTFEIFDKKKFVQFILEEPNWTLLEGYIQFDEKGLKAQAARWGKDLENKFPGVRAIRPQRVTTK